MFAQVISTIQFIREGNNIDFKKVYKKMPSKRELRKAVEISNDCTSIFTFVTSLLKINIKQFSLGLFFSLVNLSFIICTPFLNDYIIKNGELAAGAGSIALLMLYIVLFKIGKTAIALIVDYIQCVLGYQHFASVSFNVLKKQHVFNGKLLNILQTDCQKISNFPYAIYIMLINPIEVLTILGLIYRYTSKIQSNDMFFVVVSIYLVLYCLGVSLNFMFNLQTLKEKDQRLNMNLQNLNQQEVLVQREKQIQKIKYGLYIQIFIKFVSSSYYVVLFLLSFVWINRLNVEENKYLILILLGFIKSPIDRLIFASNLTTEILYSIKRIISLEQQSHLQAEITQPLITKIIPSNYKCKEKGQISFHRLKQYYQDYVPHPYSLYWIIFFVSTFIIKYFNFEFNKKILSSEYSAMDLIGVFLQLLIPLGLFLGFILISQTLSHSIFKQIKQNTKKSPQFLNRISGDIISIDKSMCLNGFDLAASLSFIIASLFYSLFSLNWLILKVIFGIFLLVCIYVSYYFQRYFMKSRRQVARKEYFLKSSLIGCLCKEEKIETSSKMINAWTNIYRCKFMGMLIEIWYNIIIFFIILLVSSALILSCIIIDMPLADKSIVIIACLQVDSDMLSMFISAIRFEKSLVSCERIINILRKKQ